MLFSVIYKLLSLGFDKYFEYKSIQNNNAVEYERIKADVEKNKDNTKGAILLNGSWWFQLFFITPLALWFFSVIMYSILFCRDCIYPQPWTIAALPYPLNDWAGWIVGFLFLVTPVGKK